MKKTPKHLKDNLSPQFDVVIVGSGPAGVNAAYPLVEAGLQVAIIDGGLDSKKKDKQLNNFSDINLSETSNAYNLLRKSSYVFNKTYQHLKIQSEIEIIQSLAKGGLSEIWHGISDFFSKEELERTGLPALEILKEYKEVARRVKLTTQAQLDLHSILLLESAKGKIHLKDKVYRAPLVFKHRTGSFIEDFKRSKNFTYIPNQVVINIRDKTKHVKIQSFSIDTLRGSTISARYVILAAGSINTTRILLRSLNLFNYKTTFLTKAQYITVCLLPRILFKKNKQISSSLKKVRLGQIVMSSNEVKQGLGAFFIQFYRFNPAAIDKALKYIPLPKYIVLPFLSILIPSIMIADVRFPAFESKKKFLVLRKEKNKKDILEISFKQSREELRDHKDKLSKIARQLRSLGLFRFKVMNGITAPHYAGGVPFTTIPGKLSTDRNGKLHQANRIYIADSSTWRALPAKPPALTIMANASRVGKNVLRKFH